MVLTKLALSAGATLAAYGVYQLAKLVIGQLNSPLRDLRGPESPSWFFGNLKQIFDAVRTAFPWASAAVDSDNVFVADSLTPFVSGKLATAREMGAGIRINNHVQGTRERQ